MISQQSGQGGMSGLRSRDRNIQVHGESARHLPSSQLPLGRDVDLAVEAHRKDGMTEKIAVQTVASDIADLWTSLTSIKVSPLTSIIRKIDNLRKARNVVVKNLTTTKGVKSSSDHQKRKGPGKMHKGGSKVDFSEVSQKLFDIRSPSALISSADLAFLEDQKGPREISRFATKVFSAGDNANVNVVTSGVRNNNGSSETAEVGAAEPEPCTEPENSTEASSTSNSIAEPCESSESSESDWSDDQDNDPDFEFKGKTLGAGVGHAKQIAPELLMMSERYGFSNGAVMNLHNLNATSDNRLSLSTVLRKRKAARLDAIPDFSGMVFTGIGFDERIDLTRSKTGEMVKEEHVAVVLFPGSVFAGHFSPEAGDAATVAKGLIEFCAERKICLDSVKAIISDGCEKNVGWKKGSHASLETQLNRPLQRILCFFHHEELGFRAVWEFHGFDSKGPTSLGEVWDPLINREDLHKLPIVKFEKMPNPELLSIILRTDTSDFSTDHWISFHLLWFVITGESNKSVKRKIGPIVLSRFTTSETRILRRYVSTENPSFELRRMVHFLVYVWGHIYLVSKPLQDNKRFSGPQLLLKETCLARKFLSPDEFQVLMVSLNRNGEFAHPENILLGLLCSESLDERQLGVDLILKIRNKPRGRGRKAWPRKFRRSDWEINPDCSSLSDLCRKPIHDVCTEPPYTMSLSDQELESILLEPLVVDLPLTTVSVERAIKEVTRASKAASNSLERDGVIHQTLKARNLCI